VLSSSDLTISPTDKKKKKKKKEMNKEKRKNLNDTRKKEKRKEWGPLLDDLLIHTSSSKAAPALPRWRGSSPTFFMEICRRLTSSLCWLLVALDVRQGQQL
jgi:hypothetical protein